MSYVEHIRDDLIQRCKPVPPLESERTLGPLRASGLYLGLVELGIVEASWPKLDKERNRLASGIMYGIDIPAVGSESPLVVHYVESNRGVHDTIAARLGATIHQAGMVELEPGNAESLLEIGGIYAIEQGYLEIQMYFDATAFGKSLVPDETVTGLTDVVVKLLGADMYARFPEAVAAQLPLHVSVGQGVRADLLGTASLQDLDQFTIATE